MAASVSFDDAPSYTEEVGGMVNEVAIKRELRIMGEDCLKIVSTLSVGSTITEESCIQLNDRIEVVISEKCNKIKQKVKDTLKITDHDAPQEIVAKVGMVQELDSFLDKLFDWIVEKLRYIFSLIKKGLQWCVQKVEEFFQHLQTLFG